MTRAIAFASALLLLPLLYWDATNAHSLSGTSALLSVFTDWKDSLTAIVLIYPLFFVGGHITWMACRAFNFTMRKLA